MSPSLFSIDEYIEITPFEMELIKNIDTMENIKLKTISVVFNLLAIRAFIAYKNKYYPCYIFYKCNIFL